MRGFAGNRGPARWPKPLWRRTSAYPTPVRRRLPPWAKAILTATIEFYTVPPHGDPRWGERIVGNDAFHNDQSRWGDQSCPSSLWVFVASAASGFLPSTASKTKRFGFTSPALNAEQASRRSVQTQLHGKPNATCGRGFPSERPSIARSTAIRANLVIDRRLCSWTSRTAAIWTVPCAAFRFEGWGSNSIRRLNTSTKF